MKAVICSEPGRLELVDRAKPGDPAKGWLRLAVSHVGICGTDYHIFQGKHPFLEYPRIMGHEISATVLDGGASGLAAGSPVIVNPYISCGHCVACRKGKPNCCVAIRVLGVHTDGAFCEEISVPAGNVYPAEGLSLEAASTVEFLAIGAHAVRRAAVAAEQKVLVVGAGPIGIGVALFSKLRGASVTVLDGRADRLAFCADRIGVASTVTLSETSTDELDRLTGGDFFDVVFDATGNPRAMESGFAYVAHGGTYVLVSIVAADIRFSDPEFHKREMTLMGSRNATAEDFATVVEAMRAGLVPTEALHTHGSSLAELPEAFPGWLDPAAGVIKAIVSC